MAKYPKRVLFEKDVSTTYIVDKESMGDELMEIACDELHRRDRANRVFALMTAYVRSGCKLWTSTVSDFIELVDDAFFELRESAADKEEGD